MTVSRRLLLLVLVLVLVLVLAQMPCSRVTSASEVAVMDGGGRAAAAASNPSQDCKDEKLIRIPHSINMWRLIPAISKLFGLDYWKLNALPDLRPTGTKHDNDAKEKLGQINSGLTGQINSN